LGGRTHPTPSSATFGIVIDRRSNAVHLIVASDD